MRSDSMLVIFACLLLGACSFQPARSDRVGVTISGVTHLADQLRVDEFSVNGHWAGGAGKPVRGGSFVCCTTLPREWHQGLIAEVRWVVKDWSNANYAEFERYDYSSIKQVAIYKATVPIEFYPEPQGLYVHFFNEGKVRVVSSEWMAYHPRHPVPNMERSAVAATQGTPIKALYEDATSDD